MEKSNFFGIRTARGSTHLVVAKPAPAISDVLKPNQEQKPKPKQDLAKPRRPRRKSKKQGAPTTDGRAQMKQAELLPVEDVTQTKPKPIAVAASPSDGPELGFVSDEHLAAMVSIFECEEQFPYDYH